jgi:hypothetical protein
MRRIAWLRWVFVGGGLTAGALRAKVSQLEHDLLLAVPSHHRQTLWVDTGCWVAMTPNVNFEIQYVG